MELKKSFGKMMNYIQGNISNTIIYVIGVITLSIIYAGIALLVKELYYFPDILFGLKINIINLSILYLLIYIIWKIVIKYISDLFDKES